MRRFTFWSGGFRQLVAVLCLTFAVAGLKAAEEPAQGWAARSDAVFHRVLNASLSMTDLAQDREGFIWVATQSGLGRWDGYKLRTYVGDAAEPGALPDSYLQALHVDGQGRLWIGTNAGGLVRYDASTDRFVAPLAAGVTLSRNSVYAMLDEGPDRMWVGTGAGLDLLDTRRGTLQQHAKLARTQGLPDGTVHALLRDASGGLWVGTDKGLFHRAAHSEQFRNVALRTDEGSAPLAIRLLLDSARRIWVATRAHGAFVIEAGSSQAVPLHRLLPSTAAAGVASASVRSIAEAAPGDLWLGTDGEGILRIDTRSWQLRRVQQQRRGPSSLPDNDILAMYRDRGGLLWVASDTALSHHDVHQRSIATWFGGGDEPGAISHANVPFVLPMPDGHVWLSVGDGGVDIVRPDRGRVGGLRPDAASPATALPPGRVLSMLRAPSGEVYLGTQRGLYRTNSDGHTVQRLVIDGRSPTASVWAMALQDGRLWLGGLDGLWAVGPDDGPNLRVLAREDGTRLADQRVVSLLPGAGSVLWVGTRSGVSRLDTTTMALSQPAQDAPGRIGLPGGYVSSMLMDRRGRLWVSGFGSGVRVMQAAPSAAAEPAVQRITSAEGLPHNGVNTLVMDSDGDVWASTDNGLAHISRDSLGVRAFGSGEGVGIPTYWTGSGAATSDGMLLFGGAGGLTIVNPRETRAGTAAAPLVVTEVQVGDAVPIASYRPNGAATPPLVIEPERRSLLVEFSLLDYAAPARSRYEYRLRGIDVGWVETPAARRIAAYTNLPPGDHVLELRGASAQGPWSEVLQLPLHVRPRWHETLWFRLGLGLAVAGLLAALVQGRTLLLRRRQRVLEALVAERTMALEQRSRELQQSQLQLEQIAYYDGLTGLGNRRLFNNDLRQLMAQTQRNGLGLYLLLIDLDHFKQINDTLGHGAGDAVLSAVSMRLKAAVRESDRVARLGGDEFAVLLPDTTEPDAVEAVCRRIVEGLAAGTPPPLQATPTLPSASIGAACYPLDAQDADGLYRAADLALYEAKRAGRNRWRLHQASVGPAAGALSLCLTRSEAPTRSGQSGDAQ